MAFVIKYPGNWFMRTTVRAQMPLAVGDFNRATRFGTREEAATALKEAKTIKAAARKAAIIEEVT